MKHHADVLEKIILRTSADAGLKAHLPNGTLATKATKLTIRKENGDVEVRYDQLLEVPFWKSSAILHDELFTQGIAKAHMSYGGGVAHGKNQGPAASAQGHRTADHGQAADREDAPTPQER